MPRFFLTHRFPSPTFHPLPCPIPPEPPQDHHKHKPTQNIAKRHKNETASLQDAKQMRRNTTARYGSSSDYQPVHHWGSLSHFFPGHGHLEHVLKITNAFGLEWTLWKKYWQPLHHDISLCNIFLASNQYDCQFRLCSVWSAIDAII